jgi:uncharacterized protein YhdP
LDVSVDIFNNVVDDSLAKPTTNARAGVKVKRDITSRMRTATKVIAGAILGVMVSASQAILVQLIETYAFWNYAVRGMIRA